MAILVYLLFIVVIGVFIALIYFIMKTISSDFKSSDHSIKIEIDKKEEENNEVRIYQQLTL